MKNVKRKNKTVTKNAKREQKTRSVFWLHKVARKKYNKLDNKMKTGNECRKHVQKPHKYVPKPQAKKHLFLTKKQHEKSKTQLTNKKGDKNYKKRAESSLIFLFGKTMHKIGIQNGRIILNQLTLIKNALFEHPFISLF